MKLYHYTDKLCYDEIVACGVIRASRLRLYQDMFAQGEYRETLPCVWLTENDQAEPTVLAKLVAAGWQPGDVRQITVDVDDTIGLDEFAQRCQHDWAWWKWMLLTAQLAGSNPNEWRMALHDVAVARK